MALRLMKLYVSADTATSVNPTPERFFYVTQAEIAAGSTLTIDAADFFTDSGDTATELPVLAVNSSYFNVFINGVLQMEDISTYTAGTEGSLAILVPDPEAPEVGEPIPAGTPIVLEVINFDAESQTDITT